MVINWTPEVDAKLLAGIIKLSQPKIDPTALAAFMGNGFTKYAVEHRIRNIVKKSDKLSSSAYGSSSKAGTAIPRKRKATDAKGNTKKTQKEETASDNAAGLYSQGDSDDIPLSNKAKTTSVLAESQKESIDTGLEAEERVKAEDEDEYAFLFSPNLAA